MPNTWADIEKLLPTNPDLLNYNSGVFLGRALAKHDFEVVSKLLDHESFVITDSCCQDLVESMERFEVSHGCSACRRNPCFEFHWKVRSKSTDDSLTTTNYATTQVLKLVMRSPRVLASGTFVSEAIWRFNRYAPFLVPLLFGALPPDVIRSGVGHRSKPSGDAICIFGIARSYGDHFVDVDLPDWKAVIDGTKIENQEKDRRQYHFESTRASYAAKQTINAALCKIRLSEICLVWASLHIPIYVTLEISEHLPGFADVAQDTWPNRERLAVIQRIYNFYDNREAATRSYGRQRV